MKRFLLACASLLALVSVAYAKPLITNSQDSYASVCIDQRDTSERLVEICSLALTEPGSSAGQRDAMSSSLGWAHLRLGQINESMAVFEDMLGRDPASHLALSGLGWVAYFNDDFTQAITYLEQANAIQVRHIDIAGLGAALYWSDPANLKQALIHLDASLALEPTYTWAMREKGLVLGTEGRFEEAVAVLQKAADLEPENPERHGDLAWVYTEHGAWEEGLDAASRALQMDPDSFEARSRRSLALFMLGRSKQAIKDADVMIAAQPGNADGYVRKARALAALGRTQDAVMLLNVVKGEAAPRDYLNYWLAHLLYVDGKSVEALRVIDQNVAQGQGDKFDLHLRGHIALDLLRIQDAQDSAKRALALAPKDPWGLFLMARVQVFLHNFDEGIETFSQAMAAGLDADQLSFFVADLIGQGEFVRALKVRAMFQT